MLKARWKIETCRKPLVISRYHCPSATKIPLRPKSLSTELEPGESPPLPEAISSRYARTQRPIRVLVAG